MNDFLSRMNILYITADDIARKKMHTRLNSYVRNIYFPSNENDIVDFYITMKNQNIDLDSIICDISEKSFDKIYQFLKKIRLMDEELPLILNLDELEQIHLMELIKFNISGCITSTTNTQKLLNRLNICCQKYHQKEMIKKQKKRILELEFKLNEKDRQIENLFEVINKKDKNINKLKVNNL